MGKEGNKRKISHDLKAHGKAEKRKAVISGPERKASRSTLVGAGVAVFAAALAGFIIFGGGGGSSPFEAVSAEAGVVRLPVSAVGDGQAHFYTYMVNGKTVNFFVLRSSDGVLRAAFDACDVCYREKKGYRQAGDLMVCNNCEQKFPSAKINEIRGGCNPAPLERRIEGGYLVLNASDIETGAVYF